jgi:hypothetical protein
MAEKPTEIVGVFTLALASSGVIYGGKLLIVVEVVGAGAA